MSCVLFSILDKLPKVVPSSVPALVESDSSYTMRIIKFIYNTVAPKLIGSDPAVYIRSLGDVLYKFIVGAKVAEIVEPIADVIHAYLF